MDEDLKVLLIQRNESPFKDMWSLPGGFIRLDESLDEAALRKLKEKTNIDNIYLEQLYTFGAVNRDPRERIITVAYFALVSSDCFQLKPSEAVKEIKWFSIYQLPPLAFDHRHILIYAHERLRNKLGYSTVGFQLLPEEFTLPELGRMYEIILQKKIDKRNFRKKILFLDILEDTHHSTQEFSKKPAKLYRFKQATSFEIPLKNPIMVQKILQN